RGVTFRAGEPVDLLADPGAWGREGDVSSLGTEHRSGRDPDGCAFPLEDTGSPGEPGAEADQHDMVATLEALRSDRFFQRERDGGGRGVAVVRDVVDHHIAVDAEPLSGRLDDPSIRL